MSLHLFLFKWMILMAALPAGLGKTQGIKAENRVPSFTMHELRTNQRSQEFATIMRTTGLIAIVDDNYSEVDGAIDKFLPQEVLFPSIFRQAALRGLCHCEALLRSTLIEQPPFTLENTDSVVLPDGTTQRTTIATATVGNTPRSLPSYLADYCGTDTVQSMEHLRDLVAGAANAFVQALDFVIGNNVSLMRDSKGNSYDQMASIVAAANHLEHFHVYNKSANTNITSNDANHLPSLDWHVDAGLFLAFVPAFDCNDSSSDSNEDRSLWFKDEHGMSTRARFPPNSIAIMLGAGAEHWLQSPIPLKATRHAVTMKEGDQRAWYGMMHLVPESAIVQESPRKTFLDMKKSLTLTANRVHGHDNNSISIGCGAATTPVEPRFSKLWKTPAVSSRRRLQHVSGPSACNNSTNFFCWMSCLDVPDIDQAESYVKSGHSLYCLDPSVLSSSGQDVALAVAECPYGVHNAKCLGSWQLTVPGVPSTKVIYNATESASEPFCYGGTSMFMDGFHWMDTVCIIYLFPDWILNTKGKFIAASFGSLVLGALLEGIILCRRMAMTSMSPGRYRLIVSALFYGLQLTAGYIGMLVVMTYSGPLFMCIILGIVSGHVLFNAKDSVLSTKERSPKAIEENGADKDCITCCALDQTQSEGLRESPRTMNASLSHDITNNGVPEGITPCCQHVL